MIDAMIPPEFWKTLKTGEFDQIADRGGYLNAEQCARLWRLTDRQGEPPQCMEVFFRTEDIDRLFPRKKGAK
jgi:hypothetical protein